MKTFYSIVLLLTSTAIFSQEFKTYENGLIYSPYAMNKLKEMVGEKNEEFRKCEFNKKYTSIKQTKGRVFTINHPNEKKLRNDLENNIPFKVFLDKYGSPEEDDLQLLTKFFYKNYDQKKVIGIGEQPNGKKFEIDESQWETSRSKNWAWDFSNKKHVDVVYFEKEFNSIEIPEKYARMIQYSECLIDTTSQIFLEKANKKQWYLANEKSTRRQKEFLDYVDSKFGRSKPSMPTGANWSDRDIKIWIDSLNAWEKSKDTYVEEILSTENKFCELINEAYDEALSKMNSSNEFESYVSKFLSPKKALELKRNRIVVGQCSMDNSPRVHAMNIAQLAGESLNWDIFLRAHLNVLNDNVSRVSDGSWAWDGRQTYIKELEELNINVVDLILGIALRSENVAEGHYFGSIGRLGRAIEESKHITFFERELPNIISDENLDDYNRLLMFYLYSNFAYHRDTDENKALYKKARSRALGLLPSYLVVSRD